MLLICNKEERKRGLRGKGSLMRHICWGLSCCVMYGVVIIVYLLSVFLLVLGRYWKSVDFDEIMNAWAFKSLLAHGKAPNKYMAGTVTLSTHT